MTLTEINREFANRASFADRAISTDLGDYYRETLNTIQELHKNGYTKNFTDDFLRAANGYKHNSGDADFYIVTCLDLRSITATKKAVRAFAEYFLHD